MSKTYQIKLWEYEYIHLPTSYPFVVQMIAGDHPKLNCYPHKLAKETEYVTFELSFKFNNAPISLQEVCENVIGIPCTLSYQEVKNINKQIVIPNVNFENKVNIMYTIFNTKPKTFSMLKRKDLTFLYIEETEVVVSEFSKCRACNDIDPYGFVDPDGVIPDNNYTCWACINHPDRRFKNIPNDKIQEFRLFYKI